jgi:tetratricopeptide (TPR) repeat protein
MKLDPASSPLTEEVAREVCLRDGGIRALISGSIQQVAEDFQIGLKLIDPSTGATALIFVEDAGSEDEVLPALRRLVRQLREALGESIESIARSQAGLEKVTTPSFAALELYSKGQRLYASASFTQAAAFFDQAIAVDPEFASGYMGRALNSNVLGRDPRVDLQKAAEFSDTVTERERLLILLTEAIFVHGDVVKAMQTSEILVREYPDDYHGRFFRSYLLLASNDWDGWLEHTEGTQRTRPNDATLHFWKGLVLLLSQGDSEAAFREAQRVLDINPKFPAGFPHFAGPCRDWMRGDLVLAREGYTRLLTSEMSKLGPIFQMGVRQFVSRFFFFANDTDMALRLLGTSQWMVPRPPDELIARQHRLELALIHEEVGDSNLCQKLLRDQADSAVGIFKIQSLGWLGIHLARNGKSVEADAAREKLQSEESETPIGFFTPPVPGERARAKRAFGAQILGEVAISNENTRQGIDYFLKVVEIVPPRGSVFASVLKPRLYLVAKESMAQAYSREGELGDSIAAYRDIIDHKVLVATTPASGQIWLRALRAIIPLLKRTGQPEEAKKYLELLKQNSEEPVS